MAGGPGIILLVDRMDGCDAYSDGSTILFMHLLLDFLFWPKGQVYEKGPQVRATHTRLTSEYSQGCV